MQAQHPACNTQLQELQKQTRPSVLTVVGVAIVASAIVVVASVCLPSVVCPYIRKCPCAAVGINKSCSILYK